MQCEDVRELLGNYIDQELTETMRERIEEHVAGCAACAGDLATLTATVQRLAEAPVVEAPNAWPFERLLDRLAREHDALLGLGAEPALGQLSLTIAPSEEEN